MKIINGVESLKGDEFTSSVVTIGNFDGVHLGHRALLEALNTKGKMYNSEKVLITFNPHPRKVLFPEQKFESLFPRVDLEKKLIEEGVDCLLYEKFTHNFASLSAKKFIIDHVIAPLKPKALVVGHDFSFGEKKSGDHSFLKKIADEYNFELVIVPPVQRENIILSTSEIKQFVASGKILKANEYLDRSFYLLGKVESGDRRGSKIGFPTANISIGDQIVPAEGVYITKIKIDDKIYDSVTNVGKTPTFKTNSGLTIETHIYDNKLESFYDKEVEVHFFKKIRDEKKFSGIEEIVAQINLDINEAKAFVGFKK